MLHVCGDLAKGDQLCEQNAALLIRSQSVAEVRYCVRLKSNNVGMSTGNLPSARPCRGHSAAAGGPSSERISCCCSCPRCPCPEAGYGHQARSSAFRGPGAAGECDGWGLPGQIPDRPLPGPPATSSKGPSASNSALSSGREAVLARSRTMVIVMAVPSTHLVYQTAGICTSLSGYSRPAKMNANLPAVAAAAA